MAYVKVKVNEIDESNNSLVEKGLEARGLPRCLGFQTPPLLYNEIEIEETEIIKVNHEVDEEDSYTSKDLNKVINSVVYTEDNKYTIRKSGIKKANKLKRKMVDEYIDHLEKCTKCKLVDLCDKLTRHYRETVNIK